MYVLAYFIQQNGTELIEPSEIKHQYKILLILVSGDIGLPKCNKMEQLKKYKELIKGLNHASSTRYWDIINCTPRCKFTKYVLKPMIEGNFDQTKMMTGISDGANIEVVAYNKYLSIIINVGN